MKAGKGLKMNGKKGRKRGKRREDGFYLKVIRLFYRQSKGKAKGEAGLSTDNADTYTRI